MVDFRPDVVASTLKRVELPETIELDTSSRKPVQGDIVAVEVVSKGGSYNKVEAVGGETLELKKGMKILGVMCERKAVKGFNGVLPEEVGGGDELHFIGGGGAIAKCVSSFKELGAPFKVRVEGFVKSGSSVLNVEDFSLEMNDVLNGCKPIVMVSGTRMDSGKTTLAVNLISELNSRGYSVGAVKLTGFTRQRDRLNMERHGAKVSMDFVDAGILSSTGDSEKVLKAGKGVLNEVSRKNIDIIVCELGGGLIGFDNVYEVLTDEEISDHILYNIVTVMDPVAAYGAKNMLGKKGMVPDLFSGPATDTTTGEELIEENIGVEALNGRKKFLEIVERVLEKL